MHNTKPWAKPIVLILLANVAMVEPRGSYGCGTRDFLNNNYRILVENSVIFISLFPNCFPIVFSIVFLIEGCHAMAHPWMRYSY